MVLSKSLSSVSIIVNVEGMARSSFSGSLVIFRILSLVSLELASPVLKRVLSEH